MVDLNINVTVKVPGLKKLSDVVASGVGAVAGSMVAPWIAERRARATRIEAQAEADSLRLIAQAQADARKALGAPDEGGTVAVAMTAKSIAARLEFQEAKRQRNIVAAVRQAAEELGDDEVPDSEPNHDWIARFFEYVQDVSDEDVRRIWASILAGEVRRQGRVSLRTLSILRNFSREEAELCAEAMRYRLDDYILRKLCLKCSNMLRAGDFYYRFPALGLFFTPTDLRPPRRVSLDKDGFARLVSADQVLAIAGKPNSSLDLTDDAVIMKPPAIELAPFCGARTDTTYLRHFARQLAGKECALWAVPTDETTAEGHVVSLERMQKVEPV